MNERIKELAEQAKMYVDAKWAKEGSPVYPEAHYLFLQQRDEKFAELIVRECANRVTRELSVFDIDGNFLLKHFGVKR